MAVGFNDWTDLGVFPAQDHDPERGPDEMRQQLVAGRVAKLREPGPSTSSEESLLEFAVDEFGAGTLGDVHPWIFWQRRSAALRGTGSWSTAWAAMSTGGGDGGFKGRTGKRPRSSLVTPIRGGRYEFDIRYVSKIPGWPKCFPTVPRGSMVLVMPGTEESAQHEVMLWADPRLVSPNVEGPAESGTLVVDLQPEAEICMGDSDLPGIGEEARHARLQSLVRVVTLPDDELKDLAVGKGNALALNYGLSDIDDLAGFGAVFGKMVKGTSKKKDRRTGPITPPSGPITPREGGWRPRKARGGESDTGRSSFGSGVGEDPPVGPAGIGLTPCGWGKFEKKTKKKHGLALMAALDAFGPIHLGDEGDKHQIGKDADGHPINSAHISSGAYYFDDVDRDGPFHYEGDYPDPPPWPLKARVHLTWDAALKHPWIKEQKEGKWRWWAEVPYVSPGGGGDRGRDRDQPTSPPGGGGGPGRGPGRPGGGPDRTFPITPRDPVVIGPITPRDPPSGRGGRYRSGPLPPFTPPTGTGPSKDWTGPQRPDPTGPTTPVGPGPGPPRVGGPRGPLGRVDDSRFKFLGTGGDTGREVVEEATEVAREKRGVLSGVDPTDGEDLRLPGVVERVGGTTREDVGLYSIFHPMSTGFASLLFRPQLWVRGYPNFAHNPQLPAQMYEGDEQERPAVLGADAWGAQGDGDWSYAKAPHLSRSRGGSASGGVLFHPPEFEMEDYFGINAAGSVRSPATTSYVAAAPGVGFALGTPTTDGGLDGGSAIFRQDPLDAEVAVEMVALDGSTEWEFFKVVDSGGDRVVHLGRGGNGAIRVPAGTTAQRPASPAEGMLRVVTDGVPTEDHFEGYDSQAAAWKRLSYATDVIPVPSVPVDGLFLYYDGGSGDWLQTTGVLHWDDSNFRLGVGTSSPDFDLDVAGAAQVAGNFGVGGTGTISHLFHLRKDGAGSDLTAMFENTDTLGPGGTIVECRVGSTLVDDPEFRSSNGTTTYAWGLDNSATRFSLSRGTVLGTNEIFATDSFDRLRIMNALVVGNDEGPLGIFHVHETTGDCVNVFQCQGEGDDVHLVFLTGWLGGDYRKGAIVAQGAGTWSRSDLHFILNDEANFNDYAIGTDTKAILKYTGEFGVGTTSPAATGHFRQASTSGAKPCLELEQDDVDEEFVEFDGTSASDGSRSLSSNTGESGACGGKVRVTINGTTKWLRFYDDHT